MKTAILTFAMAFGVTMLCYSQNENNSTLEKKTVKKDQTPEDKAKMEAQRAAKQLTLTTEQQTSWEAAALKRNSANKPLHDKLQGSTTPEERKELHKQAKVNNDAFKTKVEAFLTPEQKVKMEEIKKERHKRDIGKYRPMDE